MANGVGKYGDPKSADHRKHLRLTKEDNSTNLPLVDVLVPYCGESVDIILNTLRAACRIDYPSDRFRVLALDDGQSDHLRKAVTEMRKTWVNIHYHTRGDTNRKAFNKAGNLNYALYITQGVMSQRPEYIAVLDSCRTSRVVDNVANFTAFLAPRGGRQVSRGSASCRSYSVIHSSFLPLIDLLRYWVASKNLHSSYIERIMTPLAQNIIELYMPFKLSCSPHTIYYGFRSQITHPATVFTLHSQLWEMFGVGRALGNTADGTEKLSQLPRTQ